MKGGGGRRENLLNRGRDPHVEVTRDVVAFIVEYVFLVLTKTGTENFLSLGINDTIAICDA